MAHQPCNCIDEINAKLEEHRLYTAICLGADGLVSRTYSDLIRKDTGNPERRRGKYRMVAHTYCPFCGTRYLPERATGVQEGGAA